MRFTKMQGVGNDFVVVEAAALPPHCDLSALALSACDRHFGIGADGLLIVSAEENSPAAFRMRMFNPDGTEDMCGNGLRCVSLWASRAGWLHGQSVFTAAVKDGFRTVRRLEAAPDGTAAMFGADMGVPRLAPALLPFCGPARPRIVGEPLSLEGGVYPITVVNTGSTHTVIFGDPPDEETFARLSPQIETHPFFPERTSVLWATPRGENEFAVRIWERGAGETLGCGTGASAVGVAAVLNGLAAAGAAIGIVSKGGTLHITWPGGDQTVDMIGPAHFVYEGEFPRDFARQARL